MNIKQEPYRQETTFVCCKAICTMFLLLPALSRGAQDEQVEKEIPTRWIKISYIDFSLQVAILDVRCIEFAYGLTPNYGFGCGVAFADLAVFPSLAPVKLGSKISVFPVTLYYAPAVRWTPNYRARPIAMLFLTYGRMWFPEDDSTSIANQNGITSGCFITWQKGIPLGLKASIIYTFSDDGETTCFAIGVGGVISLGAIKGVARRKAKGLN